MYVCVQSFPTPAHDLLSSLLSSPVLLGVDMGVVVGVGWAVLVVDVGVAALLVVGLIVALYHDASLCLSYVGALCLQRCGWGVSMQLLMCTTVWLHL